MKRLTIIFFFVIVFCVSTIIAFAQNITYLDGNYKPATASNHTYKRVIKYKEPILNPNIGTGYYGNITSNVQPTGLHICSLIDYYRTGEPAFVLNVITLNLNCSEWSPDGQAIYYHKNGNIKRKEFYKSGKLNGTVINYDEEGIEKKREEFVNGKLIEEGKFTAPTDSPLVGSWKYIEYSDNGREYDAGFGKVKIPPTISRILISTFSQNGILEIIVQSTFLNDKPLTINTEKTNWKYIPKSSSSGVLEQYEGDDLLYRGNVKWINDNQFEYTNTFHTNPNVVGQKYTYTKQ